MSSPSQSLLAAAGRAAVRLVPWTVAGALLGGCAFAPGTSFSRFDPNPSRLMSWLGDEPEEPTPPPGAITRITPELVKSLRTAAPEDPVRGLASLFGQPQPYRIGPKDVLAISVWGYTELASATGGGSTPSVFNVSADGMVQFPYVGLVKAAGLTEAELRDAITRRLQRYFKEPEVTVRIQEYRASRVFVDGEVRNPGQHAITDVPMTLPEAISRAGGFAASADRSSITVSRGGETLAVNLDALTARGFDPNRLLLAPGDLVRVRGRDESRIYVMGEVMRPMSQPLKNGRLTLNEALGEAGGLMNTTADPRQIYVVRTVTETPERPQIFHLDASNPVALALAEAFPLQPKDVVYVDPVPLVRWNRVISLILPSAQAVTITRDSIDATR